MIGSAIVTSAKHMTLSLPCASLPQEMHSVASVAPPSPPYTVLSVVIWIEALCGVGSAFPWRGPALLPLVFRKTFRPPPPRENTQVPPVYVLAPALIFVPVPVA